MNMFISSVASFRSKAWVIGLCQKLSATESHVERLTKRTMITAHSKKAVGNKLSREPFWAILGASWATMGAVWAIIELSWDHLAAILTLVGAGATVGQTPRLSRETQIGIHSLGVVGHFGATLCHSEPSKTLLGPIRPSWSHPDASWGHLEMKLHDYHDSRGRKAV